MILVVSHAADEHARAVLAALRGRGARARLLDLARYPREVSVTLAWRGDRRRFLLGGGRGPPLRLDAVEAVWWRRPRFFVLRPDLRGEQRRITAWREGSEAFAGLWRSLEVRWVNHPERHEAASHKPWQLEAARRLGLRLPRTCITSDPARARAFVRGCGPRGAVFKSLQATAADWRPTRLVGPRELRRLGLVRHAPVVFQEYVPGVDVRVTAVGRRLFAAAIDARRTGSPADFRPVYEEARVAPARLPAPVCRKLRRLLRTLGLAYATVDLRRSERGEWYFLEVNPAGQWLFVEERTGQPITDAVAALLAGGGPRRGGPARRARRPERPLTRRGPPSRPRPPAPPARAPGEPRRAAGALPRGARSAPLPGAAAPPRGRRPGSGRPAP